MKKHSKILNPPQTTRINYLIYEGETEKAFFEGLADLLNDHYNKSMCNLFTGKISNKIKANNNINKIYYVIDADMLEEDVDAHIKKNI